jgi:hypothetical protein
VLWLRRAKAVQWRPAEARVLAAAQAWRPQLEAAALRERNQPELAALRERNQPELAALRERNQPELAAVLRSAREPAPRQNS